MRIIAVTGGNLFDIANRVLGDPQLWYMIATVNNLTDPWLDGLNTLTIPDVTTNSGVNRGLS